MSRTGERERTILRPEGATVGPGELSRVSVSQIATFDATQDGGCPAKWWFDKVAGKPPPQFKAQTVGVEIHGQIEHYLKTGEDVLGPVARAGKHLIPARDERLKIEYEFKSYLSRAGVSILGYMDLVNPTGFHVDEQGPHADPAGTVEVLDWKTTSNIDKWAKSGAALLRTIQMPVYGSVVAAMHPAAEHVRLSHVYFQTSGRASAEKRSTLVPLTTINDRLTTIEATVSEMKQVAREGDINKVPKNFNACSSYGGCPYQSECPRPKEVTLAAIFGKGDAMSLLDKIKKNAAPAPAPEAAPAPPAPVATPVLGLGGGNLLAKIKSSAPAPVAAPPPDLAVKVPASAPVESAPIPTGVLPPDAPKSGESGPTHEPLPGEESPAPEVPAAVAEAAPAKRGRGRPRKTAPAADVAPATPSAPYAVVEEIDVESRTITYRTNVAPFTLYLDALPVRGQHAEDLAPLISGWCSALCERYEAADVRCAPADSPLGFGKWKGALAGMAKELGPKSGAWFLVGLKESELKAVVAEALESRAAVVVRGV